MLFLVVWAHFANGSIMTVQEAPADTCSKMASAMLAQDGVTRAECTNAYKAWAFVDAADCTVTQERDTFTNYVCNRKP